MKNKITITLRAKAKRVKDHIVIDDLVLETISSLEVADDPDTGKLLRTALIKYLSKG